MTSIRSEIEERLATAWAGKKFLCFAELDSTNSYAKTVGRNPGGHGMLIVADRQTAGRGRRGREWESPSGSGIYMSLLLKPDVNPEQAPMLTLVMALSVAEAIREIQGLNAGIKWPNDIVLNGKKVCGMLTEMTMERGRVQAVIVGVGINVNMTEFPEHLCYATSLRIESGEAQNRAALIAGVMQRFEQNYEQFIREGDLSGLMDAYNAMLVNRGRMVKLSEPSGEYQGYAAGINEKGELIVGKEDGQLVQVYAGEVSVRGIYGYV